VSKLRWRSRTCVVRYGPLPAFCALFYRQSKSSQGMLELFRYTSVVSNRKHFDERSRSSSLWALHRQLCLRTRFHLSRQSFHSDLECDARQHCFSSNICCACNHRRLDSVDCGHVKRWCDILEDFAKIASRRTCTRRIRRICPKI
jgi:hypothetical protein